MVITCIHRTNLTLSFNRESIVNIEQAGILTCNSFIVLPAITQWSSWIKTFICYLQLRDST